MNYKYKPSTKHGKEHKRKYLHRIGVILTEFHSFGGSLFLQRFIRKRGYMKDVELESIFHHDTNVGRIYKTQEDILLEVGPT
jgi:hypothetical protein